MGLFEDLIDIIYPSTCPGCGKVMDSGGLWCEDCLKTIWDPRLINSSNTGHLKGCYTLCRYEGSLRDCIIGLKYNNRKEKSGHFLRCWTVFPIGSAWALLIWSFLCPCQDRKWEKGDITRWT